ncbi:MAG: hypothetical protein D6744_02255 [Planctomycetota bacterium]|nr:MAG: hypothetical protein D6744_02255 [Planctomycetota bacterium]
MTARTRAALMGAAMGVSLCAGAAVAADERYQAPREIAQIEDARLPEVSGIVASRKHAGLFYVHNDSGNTPEVFLLDRRGKVRGVVRLIGAPNIDWEDVALAPHGENAWDVCVADIGDNRRRRADVVVYRFPEPEFDAAGGAIRVRPTAFRLRYPDGAHNAEALVVDPRSGDGYIITKEETQPARVYRFAAPWRADAAVTLEHVGELKFPPAPPLMTMVTAADISPDGRRLATRSYGFGWEWMLPAPGDVRGLLRSEALLPQRLDLAGELQGEALAYTADGEALVTISEQLPTALSEVRRTKTP